MWQWTSFKSSTLFLFPILRFFSGHVVIAAEAEYLTEELRKTLRDEEDLGKGSATQVFDEVN